MTVRTFVAVMLLGIACKAVSAQECLEGNDWCQRSQLLGDVWDVRDCLGASGARVDVDTTWFYMGVTDGGTDREFRFGGRNDVVMNVDLNQVGLQEGFFLKLRAEQRYGESLAGATGTLLPANVAADLPVADSESVYLTNVLFTQMLSPKFGVYFGKLDTFDGDANAFASGRGKTQFSNVGFVVNPIAFRTVPYSTLGAGFVVLSDEGLPLWAVNVLSPTDTANTSGFDELFEEGVVLTTELRLPTQFGGLPGHQLFAATWSSRDFVSLGQDPRVLLPRVPIARQDGSWSAYWNFDQYLVVDADNPKQGWGVFGRAAIADDETNPIEYFLSTGIGGNSPIAGREADQFGIGWYYSGTSSEIGPLLSLGLGGVGDGQGIEAYYNIAVTPWLRITPDLQILLPARDAIDTAVITGLRGQLIF